MTEPLDHRLRPPAIEPLAPPTGHFDEIVRRARSRRRRRAAAVVLMSSVVLAGAAAGAALARPWGGQAPSLAGSSASASPTPAATPSPVTSRPAAPASSGLGTGPVPAHFKPFSITSVSSQVSFALGDAPCAKAPCTSLVVTEDGGHTWRGLPAPRAPLPRNRLTGAARPGEVRDVRYANTHDGWVFGGALYATHDGGRHWHGITLHDSGGRLAVRDLATDGDVVFAIVASCDDSGSCRSYRMYQAAVGTDAWRPVPGPLGAGHGPVLDSLAISGTRGIVSRGSALWVRAGAGWRSVSRPPCGTVPLVSGAAVSAAGARLVVFCGEGAAGSLYLSPWVSDDNGTTWGKAAVGSAVVPNGWISYAAASQNVLLVGAASPDLGGRVIRSTDGGRSFAEAALPPRVAGWSYVAARSATSLVALPGEPDGTLWTSRDGGRSWQEYRFG